MIVYIRSYILSDEIVRLAYVFLEIRIRVIFLDKIFHVVGKGGMLSHV